MPTTGHLALSLSHQVTGQPSMYEVLEYDLKLKLSIVRFDMWGKLGGPWVAELQVSLLCSPRWGPPAKQLHSWREPGPGLVYPWGAGFWQPPELFKRANLILALEPGVTHPPVTTEPASPSLWLVTLFQSAPPGRPCMAWCPFLSGWEYMWLINYCHCHLSSVRVAGWLEIVGWDSLPHLWSKEE